MKPISYLLLLSLLVLSCGTGSKKTRPSGTVITTDSAPYELLLVADKDWLKTAEGSLVMEAVNANIIGLPQQESNFKVMSINPVAFGKTFQGFANILMLDFGSKYKKAEFKTAYDVYAHPQLVVYLTAPDGQAMAEMVMSRQQQLIDLFVNHELKRERTVLKKKYSKTAQAKVKEMFGCDIRVPADINAVKTGKDFVWTSSNTIDNRLNICVYSYPFTEEEDFSRERFIAIRDSFMRQNILGEKDGQYMTTNPEFVFTRSMMFEGRFVMEARGLWEMENDMMGGPFVSYTQVDTVNQRVIVAEGFVYAPEKKKRPFIRELEASLQTLQLPQP